MEKIKKKIVYENTFNELDLSYATLADVLKEVEDYIELYGENATLIEDLYNDGSYYIHKSRYETLGEYEGGLQKKPSTKALPYYAKRLTMNVSKKS